MSFRRLVYGVFLAITSHLRTKRFDGDVNWEMTKLGDSFSNGFVRKIRSGEIPNSI